MERQRMLVAFAKWFLPLTGITILTFLSLSVLQGHLGGNHCQKVLARGPGHSQDSPARCCHPADSGRFPGQR